MNLSQFTDALNARGLNALQAGKEWKSRCPAHNDSNPSLNYRDGEKGLVVNCHAGCTGEQIATALGISTAEFFHDSAPARSISSRPERQTRKPVKTYDYRDAGGNVVYQVGRFEPKTFQQRRPDGNDGWINNMDGVTRILYRLPEIIKAVTDGLTIVVCEGEKDADALAVEGIPATCNVGGSLKWKPEYSDVLKGAEVVIVADKDEPGRKHAQLVAASLYGKAKSIKVIELPDIGATTVKDSADWFAAGGTHHGIDAIIERAPEWKSETAVVIEASSLFDLQRPGRDDPSELLRNRFLCRSGGMLFCGPTGVGKSALSIQCAILWALGKSCFGMDAVTPLKSLIIQAENDDGDMAEMRDGVMAGMKLTTAEIAIVRKNVLVIREDTRTSKRFFDEVVAPLLEKHRPDLLWIDPAFAYIGGDSKDGNDVGAFLRNMLNPLLHKFNCGGIVIHHTNKPPSGKEKSGWQAGDFAYAGSGSVEWANWARAVIVLRSIGSHDIFELHAAKRGGRLDWRDPEGNKIFMRHLAHSKEPGVICWHIADSGDVPTKSDKSGKRAPSKLDVMPHVPTEGTIEKESLRSKCNNAGIAQNKINGLIAELIEDGSLFEWRQKRPRTNDKISFARIIQPIPDLIAKDAK